MGGTRFVGKSLVGKLLSQNHDIDIFTRGNKANPEKTNLIKGDRNKLESIVKLRNKKYDVVYDISGRELEQTKLLIGNLDNSFQRYIYVSSAGVYKDNFELITPGIRLNIYNKDDQNRIMTPYEAIDNGASKLVIGRSISKAIDPNKALIEIFKSINSD